MSQLTHKIQEVRSRILVLAFVCYVWLHKEPLCPYIVKGAYNERLPNAVCCLNRFHRFPGIKVTEFSWRANFMNYINIRYISHRIQPCTTKHTENEQGGWLTCSK